jgi:hypothetical protein
MDRKSVWVATISTWLSRASKVGAFCLLAIRDCFHYVLTWNTQKRGTSLKAYCGDCGFGSASAQDARRPARARIG